MVRRLIYLFSVACAATLVWTFLRASPTPAPQDSAAMPEHGVDWGNVTNLDLSVAGIFLIARDSGVHRALDSLEALAGRDARIRAEGHGLAHALGRFAAAQRPGDLNVIAQCREIFEAGCYHGVLEGFLARQTVVKPEMLRNLCLPVERAHASRQPALECAHGLGHGLLARLAYDLPMALHDCDGLGAADARDECHDGVFMENVVHGIGNSGISTINVIRDAAADHQHSMSMPSENTTPSERRPPAFRSSDLSFPCDSVAEQYQGSCWSYQPLAVVRLTGADFAATLRACGAAPATGATQCYRGFGKQSTGWFADDMNRVSATCRTAPAPHDGDCIRGAVEAYIDVAWTPDQALRFCGAASAANKPPCYAEIGRRMGVIRPDSASAEADCRRAEPAFVDVCLNEARANQRGHGSAS